MNNFKKQIFLILLLLIGCLCIFCRKKDNSIVIKGNIKGLNTDKVYLYKCFDHPLKPFDSAEVVNNTFKFEFHPDTTFEPVLVAIGYTDHKTNKRQGLAIINPYTSISKKPDLYVSLYMEPGGVQLTGNLNKNPGIHLEGGPQNEFYFRNTSLAFTDFEKDSIRREAHVNAFRALIKNNTDAYWGISSLMNFRGELKKDEVQSIYNEFDDNVKTAYTGRLVKQYIENMTTAGALRPNDMLLDTNNRLVNLIDTTKKLNMLVFWASWCGPCNAEIPSLKKIAAEFKGNDFRMVSVSIDVNADQWNTVRKVRAMPWQQLIIPKDIRDKVLAQYNLQAIPQIYFVDNKRKLIKHIAGNNDTNEDICRKTIIAALNKN
jgi:thiol-disulfide isomerase/thioredoxin